MKARVPRGEKSPAAVMARAAMTTPAAVMTNDSHGDFVICCTLINCVSDSSFWRKRSSPMSLSF